MRMSGIETWVLARQTDSDGAIGKMTGGLSFETGANRRPSAAENAHVARSHQRRRHLSR
jgi:hypothetical protein